MPSAHRPSGRCVPPGAPRGRATQPSTIARVRGAALVLVLALVLVAVPSAAAARVTAERPVEAEPSKLKLDTPAGDVEVDEDDVKVDVDDQEVKVDLPKVEVDDEGVEIDLPRARVGDDVDLDLPSVGTSPGSNEGSIPIEGSLPIEGDRAAGSNAVLGESEGSDSARSGRDETEDEARERRLRGATPHAQTCSVGLACWDHSEDLQSLMERADRALYDSKEGGRDRVSNAVAVHPAGARPSEQIPTPEAGVNGDTPWATSPTRTL